MQEKHVADDFIDPLVKDAIDNSDLWDLVLGVRDIVREQILPRAVEMARQEHVSDDVDSLMRENGFFGVSIPSEYGGLGHGLLGDVLVVFETGYADLSASLLPVVNPGLFARAVQIGGTEEQKKFVLPRVVSGELFGCYGLTEPGGSSFRESIETKAVRKDGGYILNGQKVFITEADRANVCVVFACIEGSKGVGAFLVPNRDRPSGYRKDNGYHVVGKEKGKPGIHASATCAISMDDVEVPERDVLGLDYDGRQGLGTAVKTLGWSRPLIAAQALGAAKGALAYTMQYALETPRGDGSIRLLEKELYRARLGELTGRLSQGVAYLLNVTRSIDRGDIAASDPLKVQSSMLKALATDAAVEIARQSMGMLGGSGYTGEHPVGRIWTDLGVPPIYEGHNDLQLGHAGRFLSQHLKKYTS